MIFNSITNHGMLTVSRLDIRQFSPPKKNFSSMTITWNPWFFDLSMDYLLDDWENYKDWRINFYCSANLNLMISACSGNDISTHKCWKSCRYSYWNMVQRWHIPQFTHGAKGNYKCAICIPYFKWGILHNDPHSVACLRKTTIKVILQYCAKVMQTIIDEYRALFSRFIADISAKHCMDCRTLKR